MKTYLQTQITAAFNAIPGLDGTIDGVRKIKQGKHGSRSSLFFSLKNECFIPIESRLERAFCYEMEADPNVVKYRGQALEIPFRKSYLYPDFLVLTTQGEILVREVKGLAFVGNSSNLEKFHFLDRTLGASGVGFDVVTENNMLSGQPKMNQVMTYDRGGRLHLPDYFSSWLLELIRFLDPVKLTIARIRQELASNAMPAHYLEAAIFHGKLLCNTMLPILSNTPVRLAS